MQGLAGGFWWANVLGCAYCTLYWARKRMNDGTHGLMTPGGQVWVWQLLFCFVVLALDVSPWHLFWLGLVSIVLSVITSIVLRSKMLAARHPDIGGIEVQQRESWIERTSADYLADELSKKAFFTFIRESPAMKLAFHNSWGRALSSERPLTRGRLTIIFNNLGVLLAKSGDFEGSHSSFACSSLFIKGNPLTWAALAEAALVKEDRMASTWAEMVIKFRLHNSASSELREFLSTNEAKVLFKEARQRMQEIVAVCEVNTWWHNSTEVFNQMGIAKEYFDR